MKGLVRTEYVLAFMLKRHDECLTAHASSGWRVLKSHDRVPAGELTSSVLSSGDFPVRSCKQCEDREASSGLRESPEEKKNEKELCEPQKDCVWCFYLLASGEQVCESELMVSDGDELPLQDTPAITPPLLYTSLYYTPLYITDRCRNAQVISIHLIQ